MSASTHEHEHDHEHRSAPAPVRRHADVAIVGGSAAGLATALQLSRQRRSVIVIDSGEPRNAPAGSMHSYLGHEGRPPADFLRITREEVRSYGTELLNGRVTNVTRDGHVFSLELSGGNSVTARRVVAAVGLTDELPDIPGLAQHWGGSVIHCPFCHGYEVRDQRILALVTTPTGLHPLPLLRQLTDRLGVIVDPSVAADADLDPLRSAGVDVRIGHVERVVNDHDGVLRGVVLTDGTELAADAMLIGTRLHAQLAPFAEIGLTASEHASGVAEALAADPLTGETDVPGIYAVGTVTEPMLQVLPTAAAGSRVGGLIGFDLAREDLANPERTSAHREDWDSRYSGDPLWSGNPNGSLVREVGGLQPGTALDIGAGEGGDAIWLAEQGWTVTASDISAQALSRVRQGAEQRKVDVDTLLADANSPAPFGGTYDLVTAAYASIPRTPDHRGIGNMLDAVAPGGRLVVISHDLEAMKAAMADHADGSPFDPEAYVTTEALAAMATSRPDWTIEVDERRERPSGAVSDHHVHDVVLVLRRAA